MCMLEENDTGILGWVDPWCLVSESSMVRGLHSTFPTVWAAAWQQPQCIVGWNSVGGDKVLSKVSMIKNVLIIGVIAIGKMHLHTLSVSYTLFKN